MGEIIGYGGCKGVCGSFEVGAQVGKLYGYGSGNWLIGGGEYNFLFGISIGWIEKRKL